MEGNIRTFLCIELPLAVRRTLVDGREHLRRKYPELKWVHEKALHITLKFCGESPAGSAEVFSKSLGQILKNHGFPVFSLTSGFSGGLPSLSRMRTLYLSLEGEIQALSSLAEAAEEAGERSGIAGSSRPFLPHITLARARNPLNLPREQLPVFPSITWPAERIVLMKSTLLPSGPVYSPLFSWPLGEGEA